MMRGREGGREGATGQKEEITAVVEPQTMRAVTSVLRLLLSLLPDISEKSSVASKKGSEQWGTQLSSQKGSMRSGQRTMRR